MAKKIGLKEYPEKANEVFLQIKEEISKLGTIKITDKYPSNVPDGLYLYFDINKEPVGVNKTKLFDFFYVESGKPYKFSIDYLTNNVVGTGSLVIAENSSYNNGTVGHTFNIHNNSIPVGFTPKHHQMYYLEIRSNSYAKIKTLTSLVPTNEVSLPFIYIKHDNAWRGNHYVRATPFARVNSIEGTFIDQTLAVSAGGFPIYIDDKGEYTIEKTKYMIGWAVNYQAVRVGDEIMRWIYDIFFDFKILE